MDARTRIRQLVSLSLLATVFIAGVATAAPAREDPRVGEIRAHLQRGLRNDHEDDLSLSRFGVAFVDLNGDGRDEAIVYGPDGGCGTGGCGIGVYERRKHGWRLVCSTSIGWGPVGVLRTKHYGWRDITVEVSGGGVDPAYRAVLSFNGSRYPFNPSVPPARPMEGRPAETILIRHYNGDLRMYPLYVPALPDAASAVRAARLAWLTAHPGDPTTANWSIADWQARMRATLKDGAWTVEKVLPEGALGGGLVISLARTDGQVLGMHILQ